MTVSMVLLDLDGVIRHFDHDRVAAIEMRRGLPSGVLHRTAFAPELLEPVITGRVARAVWVEHVGRQVGDLVAAEECFADVGSLDDEMLAEIDDLRSRGVIVAVLTNGTDTIGAETKALGLDARVDAIFNSADIGVAKPDRRAIEHVCRRLEVHPTEVFFTDDSASKLSGAIEIGMTVRRFEDVGTFRRHLGEVGLRPIDDGGNDVGPSGDGV